MSQSETRREKRRAARWRAAKSITERAGKTMAHSDCFPLWERLVWLSVIAASAYFAANQGAQRPDCCPAPAPAREVRPSSPAVPTLEAQPQKAIVGRKRDGRWVRVEIKDGQVEETVISQGVVRPAGSGDIGGNER